MIFLEIPKNSIQESPYFVHFEKFQNRGQHGVKEGQEKGFEVPEGARPKEGANMWLRGAPSKRKQLGNYPINNSDDYHSIIL